MSDDQPGPGVPTHQMEQEGVSWEESVDPEDFSPYIPESEFQERTRRARELMQKHGMDAMVLFAYGNKQYYGGFLEANYRFTDRWRHCFIVSQEHETVFVGESVLNYLHKIRVDRAKQLLETDFRSVQQICYAVGYEDVPFFRNVFRRHTGLSPSDYRQRFASRRPSKRSVVAAPRTTGGRAP